MEQFNPIEEDRMQCKLDKTANSQLSRRQILRMIGVGSSVITIGVVSGCTSQLIDSGRNRGIFSPNSSRDLFSRASKASAHLDRQYIRHRVKVLKTVLKKLKKQEGVQLELRRT